LLAKQTTKITSRDMRELIIGTQNPSKLKQIQDALKSLKMKVIGIEHFQIDLEVNETGETAQENARLKAIAYSKALEQPVLSIDNALFLSGLPDNQQPGIHVRRIRGKSDRASDQEMLDHYSKLIKRLGGTISGHWESAVSYGRKKETFVGEINRQTALFFCPKSL